jgi:uncharacterized protein
MTTCANALVVMAKAPLAGQVKTRLVPPFSYEDAAELYACLLSDLLESLRSFGSADRFVAYSPPDCAALFATIVPQEFICFPQRGQDLGERMRVVFENRLEQGYENVVLVGSDLPALPQQFLSEAFTVLQSGNKDVVVGPNRDGGYYLIGARRTVPEIFTNIAWGNDQVLLTTLQRLDQLSLRVALLPEWFDVDTPADVSRLRSLRGERNSGLLPRTARWLEQRRWDWL